MLLRGSSLRNTDYIYGLIVFTGHDTKIMKNSVRTKSKFSRLENATNVYIIVIVIIQVSVSFTAALISTLWETININQFKYLYPDPSQADIWISNLIIKLGTWFLAIQNIVPISLMVTLEMVKFL